MTPSYFQDLRFTCEKYKIFRISQIKHETNIFTYELGLNKYLIINQIFLLVNYHGVYNTVYSFLFGYHGFHSSNTPSKPENNCSA